MMRLAVDASHRAFAVHSQPENEPAPDVAIPAIDPVCGMTVDPQKAAGSFIHGEKKYFFCAPGCLEKFKADPERYLRPQPITPIGIQRSQARPVSIRKVESSDDGGRGRPRTEYT